MNDRVFSLQLFSRVARSRSFSVAGREMDVSQPAAWRIVAALEKQICVALLVRTIRAVTLTEAGSGYLSRIESIPTALEEADHTARGTGELRCLLRVHATTHAAACAQRRWPTLRAPLSDVRIGAKLAAHIECRCALAVNSHSRKVVDREAHGRDRRQSLSPIPGRFQFSK